MVLGLIASAVIEQIDTHSSDCKTTAAPWLDSLQGGFYPKYQTAAITSSAYVSTETSEGLAYYVAMTVDGVPGVAVRNERASARRGPRAHRGG